MVVQAGAAEQMLETDPAAARAPLSAVRQTGQGALAEMRRLLGLLRDGDAPEATAPQPTLGELPALINQLQGAGMPVTLTVTGDLASLPDGVQLCAYRIVQEALTNCLKHAGVPRPTCSCYRVSSRLEVRRDTMRPAGSSTEAGDWLQATACSGCVNGSASTAAAVVTERRPDGGFRVHATMPATP